MNTIISWAEVMADPERISAEMRAGHIIYLSDVGYTIIPTPGLVMSDPGQIEAEDMVSLRSELTGVDNTVFVSGKGYSRHAPRINIAVDPPHSFNATSKSASMSIHDYGIMGEYLAPHVVEQAKRFIEGNREVLLDYWEYKIDTGTADQPTEAARVIGFRVKTDFHPWVETPEGS